MAIADNRRRITESDQTFNGLRFRHLMIKGGGDEFFIDLDRVSRETFYIQLGKHALQDGKNAARNARNQQHPATIQAVTRASELQEFYFVKVRRTLLPELNAAIEERLEVLNYKTPDSDDEAKEITKSIKDLTSLQALFV